MAALVEEVEVGGGGGGGGGGVGGKVAADDDDETKNPEEAGFLIRLRITLFKASLGGNSLICTRAGSARPVCRTTTGAISCSAPNCLCLL